MQYISKLEDNLFREVSVTYLSLPLLLLLYNLSIFAVNIVEANFVFLCFMHAQVTFVNMDI